MGEKMPQLVDVIIPMYNRVDCVKNIISELNKQTFKSFKAIFVDDGSTDNTLEVLNTSLQEAKFEHLVLTKSNGGAGSARNAGMRAADAEWISFVDSDDGLKPQFLEYLYTAAESAKAQLSICNLKMYEEGAVVKEESAMPLNYQTISSAEAMKIFCTNWLGPVCFMINRKIQRSKDLYFDERCIYNEDAPFLPQVIASTETVAYIEQELYLYYTHSGSLHRSPSAKKFYSAIESFEKAEKNLLQTKNASAEVFNRMGSARFYIATLRRAAVQLPYNDFKALDKRIQFKRFKRQIKNLLTKQQLASYLLLISKPLFYFTMKTIFKD